MHAHPAAVAFDAMGTLFPLEPLREPLVGLGLPTQALEVWYARTLRDGFALAAAGAFQTFQEVAKGVLDGLLAEHGNAPNPSGVAEVLGRLSQLPARPDAGAAMARLVQAAVRVLVLTNGSRQNTQLLLEKSGLDRFV